MKKDITKLFCLIDDFAKIMKKEFEKYCLENGQKLRKPTRIPGLQDSEIMTILIMFQTSPAKNFKYFYLSYLQQYKSEFPKMPSYERFVAIEKRVYILLSMFFKCLLSIDSEIKFIDSTPLCVCNPKRISRHKVFDKLAKIGKSTMGWFFGFKLHIIIDDKGNLLKAKVTPGNANDRSVVDQLTQGMKGFLFGDKGYISQELFQRLYERGLKLITGIKKGMKNKLMSVQEKVLLKKRSIVETVFGYLKNTLQLEHTRHRSPINAFIHILTTLISYQLKPKKPAITNPYFVSNP